jgi:hypothetical protein
VLDHQAAEPHVRKAAFYDRPNLRSQIGDGYRNSVDIARCVHGFPLGLFV